MAGAPEVVLCSFALISGLTLRFADVRPDTELHVLQQVDADDEVLIVTVHRQTIRGWEYGIRGVTICIGNRAAVKTILQHDGRAVACAGPDFHFGRTYTNGQVVYDGARLTMRADIDGISTVIVRGDCTEAATAAAGPGGNEGDEDMDAGDVDGADGATITGQSMVTSTTDSSAQFARDHPGYIPRALASGGQLRK
jgi:hypothetical protein